MNSLSRRRRMTDLINKAVKDDTTRHQDDSDEEPSSRES